MKLSKLQPKKALNKAFLKVKPNREDIEVFKAQLVALLDHSNDTESEEFHKNLVADFLKNTYYAPNHFINTKGRNDLVIHTGETANNPVGVIIEAKKPTNKGEMLREGQLNVKAFHELVLYYLRERVTLKNLEISHLIATNIYEWFIFDASVFEKYFVQNKELVKRFKDFEAGRLTGTTTDFFYKEIAEPAIAEITAEISCAYFDLRAYETPVRNNDPQDDNTLIPLFKLLSPEHLLKLPFANDSNSLDKIFYAELLHLIGLTETKIGSKKFIERKPDGQRDPGSLLENAIVQLDTLDKIRRLDHPGQFGETYQERLFNVGLDLVITWINRILFLKLLEAQLLTHHKSNASYAFLNLTRIKDFDDLNSLFFQVLARKPEERVADIQQAFDKVPYLNSSLFEPTELEHNTVFISNLRDDKVLPLYPSTVLKDANGKRRSGTLNTLEYLFAFLDAYDFASEGSEEIQEENKSLINASVLGLIFEKINGYKDGSFFTPGFITMFMCRETLRRAVVQKFNEQKHWTCKTLVDVFNNIEDREEANEIVNSLKICDPAVGSGHFLVSALNEIIAIKHELHILQDCDGKKLKGYHIEVVNDELIVTDEEDGELFEYNPKSKESQRIQETLFHEKQVIIENCLFGVDINPNSVKICRLRLWIELLKNAYYNVKGELETLPNIDINIKCGNSLISRFALDADLRQALKKNQWNITTYRNAVQTYREAESKDEKRNMEQLITDIKGNFRTEIGNNDPKVKRLGRLQGELYTLLNQQVLFDESAKEKKAKQQKQQKLEKAIYALNAEIEEIKHNKIYENAFEWRFEFPEALNDNGDFVGFDVVIENPPYGVKFTPEEKRYYKAQYAEIHVRTPESYNYFVYKTKVIAKNKAFCALIIPSSFLNQAEFEKSREVLLNTASPFLNINLGDDVFEDVATPTCIVGFQNGLMENPIVYDDLSTVKRSMLAETMHSIDRMIDKSDLARNRASSFIYKRHHHIIAKCYENRPTLKDVTEDVATGISPGLADAFIVTETYAQDQNLEHEIVKKLIIGGEINRYYLAPTSQKTILYFSSRLNIEEFPNIKRHLDQYRSKLEQRAETKAGTIPYYVMLRPRREKLFINPKILIRQTANRILAAYDEEQWYCLKSAIIVQLPKNSNISYAYLLGVLNSTLMDFIYRDLVNEDVRIFPEVKPIQLFKLPIETSNPDSREHIESLVKQIITVKRQDLKADTAALEEEIDQLVYEMYGLTHEEIQIVREAG